MAYQEGDTSPPHINVHNEVVSKLAEISAEYDLNLVLPPQRNIGDQEHVKDHNLITDALQAIDDWEAAGGGAIGAAVIGGATGAVTTSSFTGDGTNGDAGQSYDVYEFTGSGTLNVSEPGLVDALVVGGGGGGGTHRAGGGGAGGFLIAIDAYLSGSGNVTIGAGGNGFDSAGVEGRTGNNGEASRINDFISPGGGGGGCHSLTSSADALSISGLNGASGGGAGGFSGVHTTSTQGVGITGLGMEGGLGGPGCGGGGGGAGDEGADAPTTDVGGNGGNGITTSFTGTPMQIAGGGGGGGFTTAGSGGTGGGGDAVLGGVSNDGDAHTGGGGGGVAGLGNGVHRGGNGGSGYVCVRVKVASESYPFRTETTAPRTAHAARIEDGIVRQVIVIPHLDDDDAKITAYCNSIGLPGEWVDTSYTGSRRGKYAGVGDTFAQTKAGGEFISPVIEEISTADLPGEEK